MFEIIHDFYVPYDARIPVDLKRKQIWWQRDSYTYSHSVLIADGLKSVPGPEYFRTRSIRPEDSVLCQTLGYMYGTKFSHSEIIFVQFYFRSDFTCMK